MAAKKRDQIGGSWQRACAEAMDKLEVPYCSSSSSRCALDKHWIVRYAKEQREIGRDDVRCVVVSV